MRDDTPLDPDQVACPRCGSPAGVPCRTPQGRRAKTVHDARRRVVDPRTPAVTPPAGKPFDKKAATAAGRKSAQDRRRRRAEQEAKIEAETEARLAAEAQANAVRLAEDAVRYAEDRAILKRHTLDAASLAYERLLDGLRGLQRVELDDDGRPRKVPEERVFRGERKVVQVDDVRGAYPASMVERLAKVAASTLLSLRLEEDKPTGIRRNEGPPGPDEILGDAGVEELLDWANENLRRPTDETPT